MTQTAGSGLAIRLTQHRGPATWRPWRNIACAFRASDVSADNAQCDSPVVYVKAGCGSGKTLAAYLWAGANYPTRRLYFCYPTTGTATEGFRDYLHAPEAEAELWENDQSSQRIRELGPRLFHSRRDVDFEIILSTADDTPRSDADLLARLESLEAWATPVVACTVDTALGLVQNGKRGLFAWPALARSAFVFDEIHAYDDRLFGALLRFLRELPGLPALLMTASLPANREQALREVIEPRAAVEPDRWSDRPGNAVAVSESGTR